MYLVLWVNTLGNVVAVTVGYTSWDSATDAAFANWNNIVNGDKACSYRYNFSNHLSLYDNNYVIL